MNLKKKQPGAGPIYTIGIVCALCLMIVFLITAIEAVAYWTPGYYEKEYTKYQVLDDLPEMTMDDLLTVTDEMMAFLRGNREDLHVFTTMGGEYREFFTEREIAHMIDVQKLFIGGLWLRRIGLLVTAAAALFLYFWQRGNEGRRRLLAVAVPGSLCLGTGVFFGAAMIIAGIISTDFTKYFVVFHHIFFDNDLWLLDPAEDMLINIVPEPFFMDTTLRIGVVFAVLVVVFLGVNLFLWRRNRLRQAGTPRGTGRRSQGQDPTRQTGHSQKPGRPQGQNRRSHGPKSMCFLLCLTLVAGLLPANQTFAAVDWPSDVSISADGGILMDANSGAILYEKNADTAYFPASITKILTALLVIENCDLDDTVTFSNTAVNSLEPGASILGARVGDKMSVRDCLYALLLQSANEVANALAEHCSGSIEAFAGLMNKKAGDLGCVNSNFVNPSGLNDENHYTCAYDMALIAQAAFSNPTFVEIDSTTYYDVPAGQLKQYPDGWRYYAHHRMLKKNDSLYYDGIIGGKTGYTSLAGNTLVTCAERDGLKLVAVILNGHQTHYSDTRSLLSFGFNNFKSAAIADKDSTYQKIENDLTINGVFSGDTIRLSVDKNSVITLPAGGDFSEVTSSLDYNLKGSTSDTAVARIDYMYGDKKVGQAYLEALKIPGYIPGTAASLDESLDSGAISTIEVTGKSLENESSLAPEPETETPADEDQRNPLPIPVSMIKKILSVIAIIAVIGAAVTGILMFRRHREQKERYHRQQRRETRLKNWGYSSSEFDQIMADHLRAKSQIKKPSFWDRFKRR